MPSTITHAYFAKDVYKSLKNKDKILDKSYINRLTMFGQSSDPLMFYNVESIFKGKKIREFHSYFHTHDSRKYFINLCNIIKDNNLYNDKDVMSFLYGFICHYVLDSNVHPFVIYKTGYFDKKNKDTYKYNVLHEYMETYIDNIFVRDREHINPYTYSLDNIFDNTKFSDNLCYVINKSFKDTFNINNMSKIYYKAINQMLRFTRRYRKDKYGIKKKAYSLIDKVTDKKTFKFKVLSYHTKISDDEYFLNTNNKIWYNPMDNKISSHKSFYELYDTSIKEAVKIISEVNKYFNNEKIDLNKVFTNKNYLSGLDCSIPLDFKYFSF